MKKFFVCLAGLFLVTLQQPLLANESVKKEPIIYIATDERPQRLISHLLGLFGMDLASRDLPSTPVSGKFKVSSVEEVMAYFTGAYQVNWFKNGSTVYIYKPRDWKSQKIHVGDFPPLTDWEDLLRNAGLYYKEFSVMYSDKHNELIASGPVAYLKLLESAFGRSRPDPSETEPELMVFQLKYASVEDREINLRDRTFVSKGALTVLLELLGLKNHSSMLSASPTPWQRTNQAALTPVQSMGGEDFSAAQPPTRQSGIPSKNEGDKSHLTPFSVTADPRTNSIVIRDLKSKFDYYRNLIDRLDSPIAMVEVEAMLVEIDKESLDQIGLEFGLRAGGVIFDFPGNASTIAPPSSLYNGASSVVDPSKFLARIRALIADENAKVLARPNIVTQDNIPAFIDLSETQYLRVTGERVAQIVPVTAGSLLQVTPRLIRNNNNDQIFLRVDIQDGTLSQAVEGSPTVRNTVLSTQAIVEGDKALLVGGYNRDSESAITYKVPLLGDLPFIGGAFSYAEKQSQTMVRLFLITPRVIELPPGGRSSTGRAIDKIKENFRVDNEDSLKMTPSLNLSKRVTEISTGRR